MILLKQPDENIPNDNDNPQACITSDHFEKFLCEDDIVCCNAKHALMSGIIMDITGDGPSTMVTIEVKGRHPTLGLKFSDKHDRSTVLVQFNPGTPAAKLLKWRNTLKKCQM